MSRMVLKVAQPTLIFTFLLPFIKLNQEFFRKKCTYKRLLILTVYIKIDDVSPLPPTVQNLSQKILNMATVTLCW